MQQQRGELADAGTRATGLVDQVAGVGGAAGAVIVVGAGRRVAEEGEKAGVGAGVAGGESFAGCVVGSGVCGRDEEAGLKTLEGGD